MQKKHVYRLVTFMPDGASIESAAEVATSTKGDGAREIRRSAKLDAGPGQLQQLEYCGFIEVDAHGRWESPSRCRPFATRVGSSSWKRW